MEYKDIEWYRAGRVSIKNGAAIVKGVSTDWLIAEIKAGDMFTIDGSQFYEIENITSSTELNLKTQFKGEDCEGQSYSIIPRVHAVMQAEIAKRLADLLDRWASSDVTAIVEFADKWKDSDILQLTGILSNWTVEDVTHLNEILAEWQRNGITQLTELLNGWNDGDAARLLALMQEWNNNKSAFDYLCKTVVITVNKEAWAATDDSVNSYAYYADVVNEFITGSMTPIVTIFPTSMQFAQDADMCQFAFTFNQKLRVFAQHIPEGNITLSVLLLGGADLTNTSGDNTGGNSGTGDNDTGSGVGGDNDNTGGNSGSDNTDGNSDTGDNDNTGSGSGSDNTGSDNNNDSTGTGSESGDDFGLVTQEEVDDMTSHMWD